LGQLANFEGVAEIIRDYQMSIEPWDDNEPVDLMECQGCGGRGIRDGMEIARLTSICRKSNCGPLENEIARLRQQIRTLKERKNEVENEVENAALHYAEGGLARVKAELEAAEKENVDLDSKIDDLSDKVFQLELEVNQLEVCINLLGCNCEDCVEHERNYKELDDRNNQEIYERLQQDNRIIDLEYQIQLLKDEIACIWADGGFCGGLWW
jgi:predicted  nucleic acid-binding Zn-ribbon protein